MKSDRIRGLTLTANKRACVAVPALCFVMILVAGQTAMAQRTARLDGYISEALALNPQLRSLAAQVQVSQARVPQVGAWDDPIVSVEFYSTPLTSLNPFKDGAENDFSLQQMIPFPGKKQRMSEMAAFESRIAEQNLVAWRQELIANLTATYGMVLSAQQRRVINGETQSQIMQMISSMNTRYSAGQGSVDDILRLEIEVETLKNDEHTIQQEITSGWAMLNAYRGASVATPVSELEPMPLSPPPADVDSLVTLAVEHRPELRRMSFDRSMAQAEENVWRLERYPDLMIRGMYKQMRFDMPDSWALMLGVNIPLAPWSSGKYSGHIQEAQARERVAEEALVDMRNMIIAEVRSSWARTQALWLQRQRLREIILPKADQAFQSVLHQYEAGRAEYIALIDAWRMVTMARMDLAMREGEYIGAYSRMLRLSGVLS